MKTEQQTHQLIPRFLAATLLPLASFFVILIWGRCFGRAFGHGAYIAVGAIGTARPGPPLRDPAGARLLLERGRRVMPGNRRKAR